MYLHMHISIRRRPSVNSDKCRPTDIHNERNKSDVDKNSKERIEKSVNSSEKPNQSNSVDGFGLENYVEKKGKDEGVGTNSGMSQGVPLGTPQGVFLRTPQGVPLGTHQGVPLGTPQGVFLRTPQGVPLGTHQGVPLGTHHGVPLGTHQGVPLGTHQGVPLGTPVREQKTSLLESFSMNPLSLDTPRLVEEDSMNLDLQFSTWSLVVKRLFVEEFSCYYADLWLMNRSFHVN
jgi:hypothetical protein